METKEIVTTEEVMEVTEEIATAGVDKKVGIGVAIGSAVVLGGALAFKYAVKPIIAKIKAKKAQQNDDADSELDVDDNGVEE